MLLFAYREVPQESTGFAPFELLFGHDVRGPMFVLKSHWLNDTSESIPVSNYVTEVRERLKTSTYLAQDNVAKAQSRQRKYYNKSARNVNYHEGSLVLVMTPIGINKNKAKWLGPFEVIRKQGPVNYVIRVNDSEKTYHVNLLKPYYERQSGTTSKDEPLQVNSCIIEEDGECPTWLMNEIELEPAGSTIINVDSDIKIASNLDAQEKNAISELLAAHKKIFSNHPGQTNLINHEIKLIDPSTRPTYQRPYRVPIHLREEVTEDLNKLLASRIIRKTKSGWASPLIVIRKPDGNLIN